MKYSLSNKEFADLADPHSWLLVANNLYEQAIRLRNGGSQGVISLRNPDGEILADWPVENRAIFLLSGFALENMLKAFLVYENPAYVANGRFGADPVFMTPDSVTFQHERSLRRWDRNDTQKLSRLKQFARLRKQVTGSMT